MAKKLNVDEKIIIQIDPFSNEVAVQNCTLYNTSDIIELTGNTDFEDGQHIVTISAKIILSDRVKGRLRRG